MNNKQTQNEKILKALKAGERITPLGALERFGCFRLASRISDLKRQGYNIRCEMVNGANGKRWGRYTLVRKQGE